MERVERKRAVLRRRVARWLPWLIWLGIVAGAVTLVLISTRDSPTRERPARGDSLSPAPKGTPVPAVARLPLDEARGRLERAGFWVRTARASSGDVPPGHVLGTSPAALSRLGVGEQVTLLVSTGGPRTRIPSVQGLSRGEAEHRLLRRGFRVVITRRESLDPPGAVVGQSPEPGARARSHSVVRLAVAAAPSPATVPAVTGLAFERAVERASAAGFAIAFQHRRARRPEEVGQVLAQDPPSHGLARRGAQLRLTVGVAR